MGKGPLTGVRRTPQPTRRTRWHPSARGLPEPGVLRPCDHHRHEAGNRHGQGSVPVQARVSALHGTTVRWAQTLGPHCGGDLRLNGSPPARMARHSRLLLGLSPHPARRDIRAAERRAAAAVQPNSGGRRNDVEASNALDRNAEATQLSDLTNH
jgi:hypothetical protein